MKEGYFSMYNKKQRFAALLGIILLVLLYLVTLVCAIFDFDGSMRLFKACLFATIAVPILIWIYVYLFGKLNNKKTKTFKINTLFYVLLLR